MKTRLRIGVIGAGSVVREIYQHLYFSSSYTPMVEVCAVAQRSERQREWFGDLAGLPANRRFATYQEMLANVELDAVQVNTPDHSHCEPAVAALSQGLDVLVAKPTAAKLKDAHAMVQAAKKAGRILAVDYHKREDPRIKEAAARFQSGRYGRLQAAVFYMLDKLMVADPNVSPPFFASPHFAAENTPVSFLTVHMADALMAITKLVPIRVRATGYSHKLPSLRPKPVVGYDTVDTEILFENGALAHVLTGWAIPNTAWSTTVQSGRLICSEGLVDLGLDTPGLREIHAQGFTEINPLFRNFENAKSVTGYGISSPGRMFEQILARHNSKLAAAEVLKALEPGPVGLYTTLVLEGAETSLAKGEQLDNGTTLGAEIDLRKLALRELGAAASQEYGLS